MKAFIGINYKKKTGFQLLKTDPVFFNKKVLTLPSWGRYINMPYGWGKKDISTGNVNMYIIQEL